MSKEGLRDPVRLPGGDAAVVAEHEPVQPRAYPLGVVGEHLAGGGIEVDDMPTFGLRGGEDRSIGSFHPARAERHAAGVEMHVVPSQAE
jgi:hypothetical protein